MPLKAESVSVQIEKAVWQRIVARARSEQRSAAQVLRMTLAKAFPEPSNAPPEPRVMWSGEYWTRLPDQ